ncbi:MAG TPA: glycine cleavage system protein GcvH [Candidatus Limnocylindria bacterium]|nr:glycine cleavage system protein GcvH [Candidatus Limnocylindria bacterium]
MGFPDDVRYTAEHEWARLDRGMVTVGITSYATDQLGDVVFVELPEVGQRVEATKPFGVVEAVKTVSDLYAPVGGQVAEVNGTLSDNPALVNQAPFGDGWMIRIKPDNPADLQALMNADDYEKLIEEQHA